MGIHNFDIRTHIIYISAFDERNFKLLNIQSNQFGFRYFRYQPNHYIRWISKIKTMSNIQNTRKSQCRGNNRVNAFH